MHIVPVIDLQRGHVVRGVAGERSQYQPIISPLVEGSDPGKVAAALSRFAEDQTIYVADLDAIGGAGVDWDSIESIAQTGLDVWLDCGLTNLARTTEVAGFSDSSGRALAGVIVGLESTLGPSSLQRVVDEAGNRTIFSLDLKRGELLSAAPGWRNHSPQSVVEAAVTMGIQRIIVLDLAAVGGGAGVPTLGLCRELADQYPGVKFISGGGVRSRADVQRLAEAGCQAALVASALHQNAAEFM